MLHLQQNENPTTISSNSLKLILKPSRGREPLAAFQDWGFQCRQVNIAMQSDPSTIATSWRETHQTQSCHEHGISLRSLDDHRVSHTIHRLNTACDSHIRTILQRFVSFRIGDVWVSHNSPFGLIWWLSWEEETYFHGLKWLRGMIGEWFNQTTSWGLFNILKEQYPSNCT
jgi:hypothetical protein